MNNGMYKNAGFTLIELMITVTILGIVLGLAVPAMSDFATRQRVSGQASELMLSLAYARSEAIKRGISISVIPKTNQTSGWATGWCVRSDNAASCSVDGGLLKDFSSSSTVTIDSNWLATTPKLTFRRDGTVGAQHKFKVSSDKLDAARDDARCIEISFMGRTNLNKIKKSVTCQ